MRKFFIHILLSGILGCLLSTAGLSVYDPLFWMIVFTSGFMYLNGSKK